ncbi:Hypothetical protein CAP_5069 [Chondromyces apiculatus DSM 436]|uniref:DUF4349 domain-containing protein n=2 Tax=Chondromyces apiculatus TaxID=51 RepID=A0A017T3Z9_9BACT|nr:Hypothetical protein CAP_5069 [Chondromyces apiculatus DSM 436]
MEAGDLGRSWSLLDEDAGGRAEMQELAKQAPPPPPPPASGKGSGGKGDAPTAQAVAVRAPLLVYTATVMMSVFEVKASLDRVEAIGRDLGGFLAKRDDQTITLRVPVGSFDEAMRRLEDAGDMVHRNVQVEDVTEEFIDAEVRLRNARAVRDRVEKLLDRAAKVEESLVLETELGRVSADIERLEGRLKLLRDKATFSTIRVSFQPRPRESIDPSGPRLPIPWLNQLGLSRLLSL